MPTRARSLPDPKAAWRQVLARDPAADRSFVYAVETTGIFCRPTCPSRRPALRNVRFFPDAPAAMAAGYRACLRCSPAGISADASAVAALCHHIHANLARVISLQELGKRATLSPFSVQRMFGRVLGVSPRQYQLELRTSHLRRQLALGQPVTSALYRAGYSSSSRMYEAARQTLGMAPGAYRKGAPGEQISFASAPCPLGFVLVAATERGICTVSLGDNPGVLEAEVRVRFPHAHLHAESSAPSRPLQAALNSILQSLTEHPAALDLPLDIRATAFEQRVWNALRAIPPGQTRTYSDIAADIGSPRAVRAVAGACSRNPLALLVPCHRVVGRSGALTGYRWGLERKRRLLDMESHHSRTGEPGTHESDPAKSPQQRSSK